MTNKEAIEKLGYIKNQYHVMLNFTDYDEVFNIAIKAVRIVEVIEAGFKRDNNLMMDADDWKDIKALVEKEYKEGE